jgi:aspartyl/glutamyl-tRNA(Asn/Gln) amidotransferase C subunit
MILKTSSIRDVIAFPKNRSAFCPLTEAPSRVEPSQLAELGLQGGSASDSSLAGEGLRPVGEKASGIVKEEERISMEAVRHVAGLARLRVSDEEARTYQRELNAVLTHFEALQGLDTEKVHPMTQLPDVKNVWREDIPVETGETEILRSMAPSGEKGYFKVPRILEG